MGRDYRTLDTSTFTYWHPQKDLSRATSWPWMGLVFVVTFASVAMGIFCLATTAVPSNVARGVMASKDNSTGNTYNTTATATTTTHQHNDTDGDRSVLADGRAKFQADVQRGHYSHATPSSFGLSFDVIHNIKGQPWFVMAAFAAWCVWLSVWATVWTLCVFLCSFLFVTSFIKDTLLPWDF
eukprot:TRINITY_DN1895_c0_g1_i1.p1 TRINITY_DN1895_c0_g1~~TRINITY_DN1895_c0_g1_i1.p1  ORF type:complete len:182 (+),score=25.07 TRINITY_DN1895_c0_g1_i1:119-664(+)